MAWNLVSSTVKKITKRLAAEFDSMEKVQMERALSERRLAVYERALRSGQWRPCTWARAECVETGSTYRINGQHTAKMFTGLAEEFPDCHAIVEHYECDTLEDVARLYGTFDAAISSRNSSDIYRAFSASIPELAELPRKIIDTCATGISLAKNCGNRALTCHMTPSDRAENLLEHPDFVLWVNERLPSSSKEQRPMCRQGVVGAMFASWQKSKKDATEFWDLVRTESGPKPSCPDRLLAKWLSVTSVRPESDTPSSRKADAREFYVRCLHCWNAWRRKEELKIVRYQASAKVPTIA